MVLQDGTKGYLSGRVGAGGGVLFSCVSFAMAAALFGALYAWSAPGRAARRAAALRGPEERRSVLRLLIAMNVLSAVCFLGVYVSLAFLPAALTGGITAAVGPLVIALAGLAGAGSRPAAANWVVALALLGVGGALALRLSGWSAGTAGPDTVLGLVLAVMAGVSVALLAVVSARLGRLAVSTVQVMAARFHLTYGAAAVLIVLDGGPPPDWTSEVPRLALLGMIAVVLPLFLLQYALQRSDPLPAMIVFGMSPAVAYGAQVAFGGPVDTGAVALITVLILLALGGALHGRRGGAPTRSAEDDVTREPLPPSAGPTARPPSGSPCPPSAPLSPELPGGPSSGTAGLGSSPP
jgi:drug/metabolite transporter (DMT)-like permease